MSVFKLGELFCGPGGLALGAISAKIINPKYMIKHQWATDFDKDTCVTYSKNICFGDSSTVYCSDVRELNFDQFAQIDALAFGFPCNDYSLVGKQKGIHGSYGPLYKYGIDALIKFRPKWFLAENVSGLRNANNGRTFKKILNEMQDAGYVITPHLYKFEQYGVPQMRHRIIIVGIRKDYSDKGIVFRVPSINPYKNINTTCSFAIDNPKIPDDAKNHEYTRQSNTVMERLNYIKPGENAFTANMPEKLMLNIQGAKLSQIYKRLDPSKPSYTVTGSGGGGTHMYHWIENRALTNRERARLQTFPDDFEFYGSKESVRKQIGMAVPYVGAKVIFEAILKTFANEPYESVEPNISEYDIFQFL